MNWEEIINELPAEPSTRAQQVDATFVWILNEYTTSVEANIKRWIERGELSPVEGITLYNRWLRMIGGAE